MAQFLDKKERVIDFQLTPYGKHRLSVGQLRPSYYAFFDTGIVYDSKYAGFEESQSKVHERIKTETQFIEGILLFEEAENSVPPGSFIGHSDLLGFVRDGTGREYLVGTPGYDGAMSAFRDAFAGGDSTVSDTDLLDLFLATPAGSRYSGMYNGTSLFDLDISPARQIPKPEILSFESAIGDARFEGDNTQASPAWKIVSCQGEMSNIRTRDTSAYALTAADNDNELIEFNIPQIDVDSYYTLLLSPPSELLEQEQISEFVSETRPFKGGNTIKLVRDDIVIYGEEVNTELLTENFDIDIYEMIENTGATVSATGTITVTNQLDAGDTLTISDGTNSATFEFVAEGDTDTAAPGHIAVVIPSFYKILDSDSGRKGSYLNLISAINQDNGSKDLGYPTDAYTGTRADGTDFDYTLRGRCKHSLGDPPTCYKGNHNLVVNIDLSQIATITTDTAPFTATIVNNNNLTSVDPNKAMILSDADSDMSVTGFGIASGGTDGYTKKGLQLERKYFKNIKPQIVDGLMTASTPGAFQPADITPDAVEYFFDVLTDSKVNGKIACSCANTFNKNSYYIDVDFDCTEEEFESIYYDIYGSATAPEICDLPSVSANELRDSAGGTDADLCEDE
tara:strand:+ start:1145 stop:3013 length:1869 start_codon:yes stop_codon:yes gene_type:complete